MAREAYRSLYGDLAKLKDDSLLKDPAAGTGDDNEMFQLLLSVSDWVDGYCNRYFYPRSQTLEFDGSGASRFFIPDLISLTALKEDTTDDKTFQTTWAATDYWLEPYNPDTTQPRRHPNPSSHDPQHAPAHTPDRKPPTGPLGGASGRPWPCRGPALPRLAAPTQEHQPPSRSPPPQAMPPGRATPPPSRSDQSPATPPHTPARHPSSVPNQSHSHPSSVPHPSPPS